MRFLMCAFLTPTGTDLLGLASPGGAGQNRHSAQDELDKLRKSPFPQVDEQQRIADCLSLADARIAAEADKLAALKTHKKGLMQQLFPSPEDLPELMRKCGRSAALLVPA